MNTSARITTPPAPTSAPSATPVAPATSTTTTNATYRTRVSPTCATISINNATVREPSRAIRMSNSTASPLTRRSLAVAGGWAVTRTVKHNASEHEGREHPHPEGQGGDPQDTDRGGPPVRPADQEEDGGRQG